MDLRERVGSDREALIGKRGMDWREGWIGERDGLVRDGLI